MTAAGLKIFSGNAHPGLAAEIADYLGVSLGEARVTHFSDGEITLAIDESVRGLDAFVIQPTCRPNSDNILELLILIDALKRASADRITAVIPYYGYSRHEVKAKGRDPITAKMIANLITKAGADRVLTIDLHVPAIQGFFDIPVDHLTSLSLFAEYFRGKGLKDLVVVSPDYGGVQRARNLAERIGATLAILDKRYPEYKNSCSMNIIGNVKDKNVIIIDDIIDTAETITQGDQDLRNCGAKAVYVCCTHPVLSWPSYERLDKSIIKEVVVTNTIPLSPEFDMPKISVLSVAPLFGDAILRIHKELSVSELFN